MKLQNPFLPEVRNLYLFEYACQDCGKSGAGLELHHIASRVSSSALNAIMLCIPCHSKCGHSEQEQARYFKIQMEFLARNNWIGNDEDNEFYTGVVEKHLRRLK